jgi:hypothetical protein
MQRFSVFKITSGLPDDCREAEVRSAGRRLREFRAPVNAARERKLFIHRRLGGYTFTVDPAYPRSG